MHRNINVAVGGPVNADYQKTYKTVFLKPAIPFALQVTDEDTKYVIKHNFDLGGESVTIPAGCILDFDGGCISNGTLVGHNTCIEAELFKIFNTDITLTGTWNVAEAYPEWFGAKGDGLTDDIDAFNYILTKTPFDLKMQKNKVYGVSESVIVNVQEHSIFGVDGTSKIKALNNLDNALVVIRGYGNNNWEERQNRVRKHGNFTLICGDSLGNRYCDGLRIDGETGTALASHVDEQYVENIFIDRAKTSIVVGSHVYKIKLFNIIQRNASISPLSYDLNSTDDGECTEFEQCSFWDSNTTIVLRHQTNFINCTFHCDVYAIGTTNVFDFFQCHFEFLSNESINGRAFLRSNGAFMSLTNCDATIADGNSLEVEYFAKAEGSGCIIINGGSWKWFLMRLNVTSPTITSGNVKCYNTVMPFGWYSYGKMNLLPFYDSTIKTLIPTSYGKIANIADDYTKSYPFESYISGNKDCNYSFTLPDENGHVTLTVNNLYGAIYFRKRIKPYANGTLLIKWDVDLGEGVNFSLPDGGATFLDAGGNVLPYKPYNYNNDITLNKTYSEQSFNYKGGVCVAIPPATEEVVLRFAISRNASIATVKIKEFYCEFI